MSVSCPVSPASRISRRRVRPLRFGALLAAGLVSGPALCVPVATNATIFVTASRADRTAEEMPASVTVITAERLRDAGSKDVVHALENLGGVYFRHNSDNPGLADISMRGFGENSHGRVLVLVDGQRLNTADMATLDWLRIPVSSVERIEVLRGGQTALYGNYAVAGVVNIITRQSSDQPVTTFSASGGSDNTFAGHVGHSGSVGDTRYTADLDWRKSDGWRDHSQYQATDLRASVARDWTERLATTLSGFYTRNDSDMPGYLTRAQTIRDPRQAVFLQGVGSADNETFGGNLNARGQLDSDSRIESDFGATRRTVSSDWPGSLSPSFSDTILNSFAVAPRYIQDADLAGHRNRLLAGIDAGVEQYDLKGYSNQSRASMNQAGNLDRTHAAAYLQDEFWLTRELSLTLGARGEWCRYEANVFTRPPFSDVQTSAKNSHRESAIDAALVYRPLDNLKLYARYATLYRNPFVDEMTTINTGFASTNGPMNTALKPEVGNQIELGGTLTIAKEWTLDVAAYRLDMRDEIAWRSDDPGNWAVWTGYNANLDQTRRYGADTTLAWARRDVGLASVSYNCVYARFTRGANQDQQIPLVPAHVLTARGELELPSDFTALAATHAVCSQYSGGDTGNRFARLPSYGTLDLGLRYHPRAIPGLDMQVGVDNVFDHRYANSGYYAYSYYPAAGRTWRIGASYRF
jgi:iron complex outermembrane receptor protein